MKTRSIHKLALLSLILTIIFAGYSFYYDSQPLKVEMCANSKFFQMSAQNGTLAIEGKSSIWVYQQHKLVLEIEKPENFLGEIQVSPDGSYLGFLVYEEAKKSLTDMTLTSNGLGFEFQLESLPRGTDLVVFDLKTQGQNSIYLGEDILNNWNWYDNTSLVLGFAGEPAVLYHFDMVKLESSFTLIFNGLPVLMDQNWTITREEIALAATNSLGIDFTLPGKPYEFGDLISSGDGDLAVVKVFESGLNEIWRLTSNDLDWWLSHQIEKQVHLVGWAHGSLIGITTTPENSYVAVLEKNYPVNALPLGGGRAVLVDENHLLVRHGDVYWDYAVNDIIQYRSSDDELANELWLVDTCKQ